MLVVGEQGGFECEEVARAVLGREMATCRSNVDIKTLPQNSPFIIRVVK